MMAVDSRSAPRAREKSGNQRIISISRTQALVVEVRNAKTQPGISQFIPSGRPSKSKTPAMQKDSVVSWQSITRDANQQCEGFRRAARNAGVFDDFGQID